MSSQITIFIISPIPWEYHNNQIQRWTEKISQTRPVLYLDTYSNQTYQIKSFFRGHTIQSFVRFYRQLLFRSSRLITSPPVLTINRYASGEIYHPFDQYLYLLQILLWVILVRSNVIAIVYSSFFQPTLTLLPIRWIYDFFDRIFFVANPDKEKLVRSNELWLIKNSHPVIYPTVHYRKFLTGLAHSHSIKVISKRVPLGYDVTSFLQVSKNTHSPITSKQIVIGYEGGISDRIDYLLVLSIIKNCPEFKFVFVGPVFHESWFSSPEMTTREFLKNLLKSQNVTFIEEKKTDSELAKVMRQFTIGWLPYNTKLPFNLYSHPTKFLQYAACGLPIVSTKLPTLSDPEYQKWIYFFDSVSSFTKIIKFINDHYTYSARLAQISYAQHQSKSKVKFLKQIISSYEK